MSTDAELNRALAAVTATLKVNEALGGQRKLEVDDGGGVHDETGARVDAIRRTDSGEWIAERQNPTAERSDTAIPKKPPQSKVRSLMTKLKVFG